MQSALHRPGAGGVGGRGIVQRARPVETGRLQGQGQPGQVVGIGQVGLVLQLRLSAAQQQLEEEILGLGRLAQTDQDPRLTDLGGADGDRMVSAGQGPVRFQSLIVMAQSFLAQGSPVLQSIAQARRHIFVQHLINGSRIIIASFLQVLVAPGQGWSLPRS